MPDHDGRSDHDDRSDRDARFVGYARAQVVLDALEGRRLVVRPAARPGPYPLAVAPVHVLTAYDPGAQRPGTAENRRRQRALEAELAERGLVVTRAVASAADGSHAEESAAVVGWDDAEALALARRYGQDAIFRWTPTAWAIVPCDGGAPLLLGWSVEETGGVKGSRRTPSPATSPRVARRCRGPG